MVTEDLWQTAHDHERRISDVERLIKETREDLKRIEATLGTPPITPESRS